MLLNTTDAAPNATFHVCVHVCVRRGKMREAGNENVAQNTHASYHAPLNNTNTCHVKMGENKKGSPTVDFMKRAARKKGANLIIFITHFFIFFYSFVFEALRAHAAAKRSGERTLACLCVIAAAVAVSAIIGNLGGFGRPRKAQQNNKSDKAHRCADGNDGDR